MNNKDFEQLSDIIQRKFDRGLIGRHLPTYKSETSLVNNVLVIKLDSDIHSFATEIAGTNGRYHPAGKATKRDHQIILRLLSDLSFIGVQPK